MSARYITGPAYAGMSGLAECIVVDTVTSAPAYIALGPNIVTAEENAALLAAMLNDRAQAPDFHWLDDENEAAAGDNIVPFPVRA